MADSGSEEETVPTISIILKSSSIPEIKLHVSENITIGKLKEQLSGKTSQPVDKICLIFSGKILKDHDTLKTYNITDGMAVHMVFRNVQQPASTPQRVSPDITASAGAAPRPDARSPNIPGLGGMNFDTARRMMNTPIVQQMLNNPEFLRNMISGNEQIQNIARQNPEIGHLLNDPEIIRQTIDMIRNPSMFQEMMRNHDQAIRNLQGIPGGEAALQRLYQDVQEPLLNSATSGGNPFASGSNAPAANTESRSQRAGVENADPLPNPWGGRPSDPTTNTGTVPTVSTNTSTGAGSEPSTGTGGIGDLLSDPAMQDTMQRMLSNPEFMRNMMSPQMLRQAQQMFGGNAIPSSDEDISRLSEQVGSLMSNPDMVQAMMNPRVIQAMNNIRTSLDVIRTEAPGMFNNLFQGLSTTMGSLDSSTATPPTSGGNGIDLGPNDLSSVFGGQNPQRILEMFSQLTNSAGTGAPDNRPPEERFRDQLEQLVNMGFTNQEANIRALQDAQGDVNAALDRLLHQR